MTKVLTFNQFFSYLITNIAQGYSPIRHKGAYVPPLYVHTHGIGLYRGTIHKGGMGGEVSRAQ